MSINEETNNNCFSKENAKLITTIFLNNMCTYPKIFDSNNEELGIKHKKKLKEFALIIKDKPVKIIIRTYVSKNEKDYNKYKKILKSRSLFVRAFLINQGISHNRIKIETNEENITKNWKNEVILNFIGV